MYVYMYSLYACYVPCMFMYDRDIRGDYNSQPIS